jgi:hypothetical protein
MLSWPPSSSWETNVGRIARKWRKNWNQRKGAPTEVRALWKTLLANLDINLAEISDYRGLCVAMLELCAIADETSFSLGIPPTTSNELDNYFIHAAQLLINEEHGATLCEQVHPSKTRVLPKMHTPQSGLTFRSFSLHLALYPSGEMRPEWVTIPSSPNKHKLTLLLVPWPYVINKSGFRKVAGEIKMPSEFGFFEYTPDSYGNDVRGKLASLLERARKKVGHIDGVVLPELSIGQSEYVQVRQTVLSQSAFLIAGVYPTGLTGGRGGNCVHFDLPLPNRYHNVQLRQAKHHRWRLDRGQINRYGLKNLSGKEEFFWEHIEIENRRLYFVTLRPWLTVTVLICEDLARPDPVGDLVRAVGPNLVVSLLLDGPQLPFRWSARYAAALSDDPGCSVLTLTSLGMADLGCPRGRKDPGDRLVALWRDGGGGETQTIRLPDKREGIIVEINVKEKREYTADGRNDYGATGYPLLKRYSFV